MSTLQILGLFYLIIVFLLFLEAYFYTEMDPESKKFLKNREKLQHEKANKE